jgi:hypothetical protein
MGMTHPASTQLTGSVGKAVEIVNSDGRIVGFWLGTKHLSVLFVKIIIEIVMALDSCWAI